MNPRISEHLSYDEICKSQTAIRNGIDNSPNKEQLENIILFAEKVFEPLRKIVSTERGKDTPLHVSSCFRCEALNNIVKGSSASQHCSGQAMDIDMDNYDDYNNARLFNTIKDRLDFDQLIWEFGNNENPEWVHVSYKKDGNRKKLTKAITENGVTRYIPYQ